MSKSSRITIMIDNVNLKNCRIIQARRISKLNKSVSLSSVINDMLENSKVKS